MGGGQFGFLCVLVFLSHFICSNSGQMFSSKSSLGLSFHLYHAARQVLC